MSYNRVRVNTLYRFVPVPIDFGARNVEENDIVRVFNLYGCPKANMMGHCYIQHLGGEFIQLVCTNSLVPLNEAEKRIVRKARTASKYRQPTPRLNVQGYGDIPTPQPKEPYEQVHHSN
jgi:hypothetical protein